MRSKGSNKRKKRRRKKIEEGTKQYGREKNPDVSCSGW